MPFLSLHLVVEMDTTDKLPAVTLWRWTGEWRPGEKGARGGGTGEGKRRGGKRDSKVAGSGRKRETLRNIVKYFAIEKMQRGGSQ